MMENTIDLPQTKINRFVRRCILAKRRNRHIPKLYYGISAQIWKQQKTKENRYIRRHIIAEKRSSSSHNSKHPKPGILNHLSAHEQLGCTCSVDNVISHTAYAAKPCKLKRRKISHVGECSHQTRSCSEIISAHNLNVRAGSAQPSTSCANNNLIDKDNEVATDSMGTTKQNTPSGTKRVFLKPWNFGGPTEECEHCKAVVWAEESVGVWKKNRRPQFSICCQRGKVKLPLLQDPPEYLKNLIDPNGGARSTEFRRLIRSYNSIFAFTSMGGKVDNVINKGSAPYCFRLGGQNHHNIGSILPPVGKQPRFLQLYFYDGAEEVNHRINSLNPSAKNKLDPSIVEGLSNMLHQHNKIARVCKMAKERISATHLQPVKLHLISNRKKDARQYNLPTTDELAALIVGSGEVEKGTRDIIIDERATGLRRIKETYPGFMAMQYPLMFPYGEDGFTIKGKKENP